ncbi:MAG: toxin-antitoxin system YwqK family antitoxin, partial [Chlamydiia bacterium]|nr:toxin-antitoxin system YwqK family antitoxin [Chlamydiia bacterium]
MIFSSHRTLKTLLTSAIAVLLLSSCSCRFNDGCSGLTCINIIDCDGMTTTIRSKERLKNYANVDFLTPQPYQKVLRVYERDNCGNVRSVITSYYPNSQPKQCLEILNGRAYGFYREWYSDGTYKLESQLVGGIADITPEAENSWLFDGCCRSWDCEGNLEALFYYEKGRIKGDAEVYYPDGRLRQLTPYVNGQIQGVEKLYFPNGSLCAKISYSSNERDGRAVIYRPSGTLASEEIYYNGKLLSGSYFDSAERPIGGVEEGAGFRPIFDEE